MPIKKITISLQNFAIYELDRLCKIYKINNRSGFISKLIVMHEKNHKKHIKTNEKLQKAYDYLLLLQTQQQSSAQLTGTEYNNVFLDVTIKEIKPEINNV